MNLHSEKGQVDAAVAVGWSAICFVLMLLVVGLAWGCPQYNVWRLELAGKAQLKEATWSRKIAIEEAQAKKESAVALAAAEVERAKGVAQANEIIGDSLKGNDDYLRYLWIEGLREEKNKLIYVPTEAGMPILEAGRLAGQGRSE